MHCTSVHTAAGYSAIKHAFFGRFVCTIVCRQRSNSSALGSGRTAAGGFAWLSGACSLTAGAPFLPDCALADPARRTITAPNLAAVNTREHHGLKEPPVSSGSVKGLLGSRRDDASGNRLQWHLYTFFLHFVRW